DRPVALQECRLARAAHRRRRGPRHQLRARLERDRPLRPDGGAVRQGGGGWRGGGALQVRAGELPHGGARLGHALAGAAARARRRRPVRRRAMNVLSFCPKPPAWRVDWPALHDAYAWVRALAGCPQDPAHHAEGDVWVHTRMVCEALASAAGWRGLPADERAVVFAAALLHDVAKPECTRAEPDGRVTSRGHSRRGSI